MARIALAATLVVTYLASMIMALVALDDHGGGWQVDSWWAMSVLLGAGTKDGRFALLSLAAIPIAVPFGFPADAGDPAFPLWLIAMVNAAFSAALVAFAALARQFVESRLRTPAKPK